MKRQIENIGDIEFLVNTFYERIRKDELLGPIFNEVIKDKWPLHLEKMYRFWQTLLLEEHTYYGSPFAPHAGLPVGKEHFDRWLQLFHKTVDIHFEGERAAEAKMRAAKMADMFQYKIAYLKEKGTIPLK